MNVLFAAPEGGKSVRQYVPLTPGGPAAVGLPTTALQIEKIKIVIIFF